MRHNQRLYSISHIATPDSKSHTENWRLLGSSGTGVEKCTNAHRSLTLVRPELLMSWKGSSFNRMTNLLELRSGKLSLKAVVESTMIRRYKMGAIHPFIHLAIE